MSIRNILTSLPNILNPKIPPRRGQRHQHWSTSLFANPISIELFDNTIPINLIILEEDFCLRENAYLTFPPEVNNFTIRKAIGRFQVNIENTVKHMDYICYYYSRFIDLLELKSIPDNDIVLIATFEINILHCCNFDI